MSVDYQFKFMPLVGKLPGKSMAEQTETAINEIAQIVNENTAQAEIINTLAEQANSNSVEALEKANEALETSGRVYITEDVAVNLNSYCESELLYIANVQSTNLPVVKKGFLEVKTNDDKTEAVQMFVSDDKDVFVRSGTITATTVGDVTSYSATYTQWVSLSSPSIMLAPSDGIAIALSTDLNNLTTEGTYYCTSTNAGSVAHSPYTEGEFKLIVMKYATANYGVQILYPSNGLVYMRKYINQVWQDWVTLASNVGAGSTNGTISVNGSNVSLNGAPYLPLAGGTLTGNLTMADSTVILGNNPANMNGLYAGANNFDGATLQLFGRSNETYAGRFYLRASTKSSGSDTDASHDSHDLWGTPDGILYWNGRFQVNHDNSTAEASGIRLVGSGQNFALSVIDTSVAKGTAPSANKYWGIDFYGNSSDNYNKRIGMLETNLNTSNVCSTAIRAYNCTTNTNTNNCTISCNVDGSGNAYTYAPTPSASDNTTKIATTAYVKSNVPASIGNANTPVYTDANGKITSTGKSFANYLPLAGGTMTGTITRSGWVVKNSADNSYIEFLAGTDETSSYISIYGKNHSSNAGIINLRAYDGTNSKYLQLKPDGTLTWGGTAISLSGHTHSYLPLSGGTMTGLIKRNGDFVTAAANDQYTRFSGGTAHDQGAALTLSGKDHSWGGKFNLKAVNASATKVLEGTPSGVLTWGGNNVLTDATVGTRASFEATPGSVSASTAKSLCASSVNLAAGTWVITGHVKYSSTTAGKNYGIVINTSVAYAYDYESAVWCGAGGANTSLQTTRIMTFSSATKVYVVGYTSTACTADKATLLAVRIV